MTKDQEKEIYNFIKKIEKKKQQEQSQSVVC